MLSMSLFCSHLLIAYAIANFVNPTTVEAFQTARHSSVRVTPSFSSIDSATLFSHFVSIGTKPIHTRLFETQQDDDANTQTEEQVAVGTQEYYKGFLSSPIQDETVAERGSGLEQALKLGGGVIVVLVVLVVGFLASNGLI